MQIYDVCLMSDWHYDRDLLVELENRLQLRGRTTYLVWPENLEDVLERLREGTLSFRYFVDRATNTSAEFSDVYRFLPVPGATCFEDPGTLLRASDKALMHREFQAAGIPVPHTLIIQPHAESEEIQIDREALQELGPPFVIKPANTTGGGVGVFQDGRGLEDILHRRLEYPSDKYLVQERILPKVTLLHCNSYISGVLRDFDFQNVPQYLLLGLIARSGNEQSARNCLDFGFADELEVGEPVLNFLFDSYFDGRIELLDILDKGIQPVDGILIGLHEMIG